jgi:hypothetical protein
LIKGENAEEIRKQFNIVHNFTQVLEANKWAEVA